MKKVYEIENIDRFIKLFNKLGKWGVLKRISNELQENPDAICLLNDNKKIGIEATLAILQNDANPKLTYKGGVYNPYPAIEKLIEQINKKTLNNYKTSNLDEVWLLVSGGSLIHPETLNENLKESHFKKSFDRIFIHQGIIGHDLIEITQD